MANATFVHPKFGGVPLKLDRWAA